MKKQHPHTQHESSLERRTFLTLGIGAGALMSLVKSDVASAQGQPAWEARPANTGAVRPISIDML